jgi:hypothetical protein
MGRKRLRGRAVLGAANGWLQGEQHAGSDQGLESAAAVLNVLEPEGNSFNDGLDSRLLEKKKMDTARAFS